MRNRILRSHCRKWHPKDEPKEIGKCQKLGDTQQPDRNTKIPRVYRILQIFHPELLNDCTTTTPPYEKDNPLGIDRPTTTSLWPPKDIYVQSPSVDPTQLQQEILPPSGCLSIWCGRCTLTRGRNHNSFPQKMTQTNTTPHCILLSNIHSHRVKLQHI